MRKQLHIGQSFLHVLEFWALERDPRVLKKKVYNDKNVEKELQKLALEERLVQETADIEINEIQPDDGRVLKAEIIEQEIGSLSECLLMRRLKCSRSEACAIMKAISSRKPMQHNRDYPQGRTFTEGTA